MTLFINLMRDHIKRVLSARRIGKPTKKGGLLIIKLLHKDSPLVREAVLVKGIVLNDCTS